MAYLLHNLFIINFRKKVRNEKKISVLCPRFCSHTACFQYVILSIQTCWDFQSTNFTRKVPFDTPLFLYNLKVLYMQQTTRFSSGNGGCSCSWMQHLSCGILPCSSHVTSFQVSLIYMHVIIDVWSGERPFRCPVPGCERSFTTSNIRKVHVRTHTGERPYVCPEEGCDRAFASATNYKNHLRIHSGEKPYVCTVQVWMYRGFKVFHISLTTNSILSTHY
jgi:hypothetical protein